MVAGTSVAQAFQTTLVKHAIKNIKDISSDMAEALLKAKLGKVILLYGVAIQAFGIFAAYVGLITSHSKWTKAMLTGNKGMQISAAAMLAGSYGTASVTSINTVQTGIALVGVYRDIKIASIAAKASWAICGVWLATAARSITPWGLAFTALQLIGEAAYNYYNLSETQDWYHYSCWGRSNKD